MSPWHFAKLIQWLGSAFCWISSCSWLCVWERKFFIPAISTKPLLHSFRLTDDKTIQTKLCYGTLTSITNSVLSKAFSLHPNPWIWMILWNIEVTLYIRHNLLLTDIKVSKLRERNFSFVIKWKIDMKGPAWFLLLWLSINWKTGSVISFQQNQRPKREGLLGNSDHGVWTDTETAFHLSPSPAFDKWTHPTTPGGSQRFIAH